MIAETSFMKRTAHQMINYDDPKGARNARGIIDLDFRLANSGILPQAP